MTDIHVGNTILISYPKAGRTWVRVILAELSKLLGGDPTKKELIYYQHSGSETRGKIRNRTRPKFNEMDINAQRWKGRNLILLSRDPRDVVVSLYFHAIKREDTNLWSSISDFIRDDSWGVRSIITFYNKWYESRNVANKIMLLRYEDLHKDCEAEIRRVTEFCDLDIDDNIISKACQFGSFDNMRKIEVAGKEKSILSNSGALTPGNIRDPESFKVRKGKVGGFREYLSDDDITYVDHEITHLASWYGY